MIKDIMPAWEVVKVIDLNEIVLPNDSPRISFRVEILRGWRSRGTYRARVYRKEAFRIQPTFPQKNGVPQYEPSDEAIFIEDSLERWEEIKGRTTKDVLNKVLRKLKQTFCQKKNA